MIHVLEVLFEFLPSARTLAKGVVDAKFKFKFVWECLGGKHTTRRLVVVQSALVLDVL